MRSRRGRHRLPREVAGQHWRNAIWAVLDVETTGLDARSDEIVSIGVVPIRNGLIECEASFYSLVRPVAMPTGASIRIHSITATDLHSAPAPEEVASELSDLLAGTVLVAHAAWIERAFLHRLAELTRVDLPTPLVDTAALSRALGLDDSPDGYEPSLEQLARRLDLPVYTPHHALGDAMTTAVLLLALTAALEALEPGRRLTVGQLADISAAWRA